VDLQDGAYLFRLRETGTDSGPSKRALQNPVRAPDLPKSLQTLDQGTRTSKNTEAGLTMIGNITQGYVKNLGDTKVAALGFTSQIKETSNRSQ
jgi:hypothetical protein